MLIFDFDNYDGALSRESIVKCKAAGMQGAIVGLQAPGPQYPPFVATQQIIALIEAGVSIEGVYAESQSIVDTWPLVQHLSAFLPRLWIACEEDHVDQAWIDRELAYGDALKLAQPVGVYTGAWWWRGKPFAGLYGDRQLWAADYDGHPDAETFAPFGAWTFAVLKQFAGAAMVGQKGLDLNVDRRWR